MVLGTISTLKLIFRKSWKQNVRRMDGCVSWRGVDQIGRFSSVGSPAGEETRVTREILYTLSYSK